MRGVIPGFIALLMRRLFDVLRGIDMAIWGLIFVRAVGLGPLAGVLAIIMQDTGLLGGCTRKDTRRLTAHRGAG
jgi:phosphonate transport system permease protein